MKESDRCNMRVSKQTKKLVLEAKEKLKLNSADDVVFIAVSRIIGRSK